MSERPMTPWERDQARLARIRELRAQRESPYPRPGGRFQPVVLLGWFLVVMLVAAVLIGVGFVAFAPRLMSWVEENPGALEHGVIVDFVRWYEPETLADIPASESRDRITVEIPQGASDADIGQLLHDAGLVTSPLAFQYAVLQAGREGSLQAGPYDLSPSLRPSEIVVALQQEATGPSTEIRIGEGWRLEEIVGYISTTELTLNVEEFATLVQSPPPDLLAEFDFLNDLPNGRSLEGYLYPDTYIVETDITPRDLAATLLGRFGEQLTPEIREQLAAASVSIDDAVTLASIIEREAVLEDERPLIAGVYLNRLRDTTQEWVLNADPTLQYALATTTNAGVEIDNWASIDWWPPLEVGGADIALDDFPEELRGYHTYLVPGLPPTPIAAPRVTSIAAVAAPDTQAGYFYFVAACPEGERTGAHRFATTIQEHEANVQLALNECPPG